MHHAGLESRDRQTVEELFGSGDLRVVCATSTVAQGVNMPAHLVIIKGTGRLVSTLKHFTILLCSAARYQNKTQSETNTGGYQEYSKSDILQVATLLWMRSLPT